MSILDMFIRNASSADRMQLIESGILDLVADEIYSEGFQKCGDLQIYFDFLSEIVRFDFEVFAHFEVLVRNRGVRTSFFLVHLF